MDTEVGFRALLQIAGFGQRPIQAIIDFCCDCINDMANLPTKDLDNAITTLHKSLSNLAPASRVRLSASRVMILHSLRQHFLDRI